MTKHLLLSCAMAAVCALSSVAQNHTYYSDNLGEANGVSDNGRYVTIGDIETNGAYLWCADNPDVFTDITPDPAETAAMPSAQQITGALAYDASDDGMVVGTLIYADGHSVGAIYTDGKWVALPLHPAALNTNEALAVTPDGKTILGYQFIADKTSDIAGRYYPVQWTLNDKGSYDLTAYTELELPDHQGFIPMTQSVDGKVFGGTLYCGAQSTIPALVVDGKLKVFNELTSKQKPWIFKDKYYCGFDDNGSQIWSEDPEDPRIVLFTENYIDGYDDGNGAVDGSFVSCDSNGNFYGMRTLISNVDEDGNGTLRSGACVYNVNTDTWKQNNNLQYYTAGVGTDLLFGSNNTVLIEDEEYDIADEYGIETTAELQLAGVNKISANGKVLGGMMYEINMATGTYQYYPFVTVLEGAFPAGVGNVFGGSERPSFVVSGSCITLHNGESMTVYDTNGHIVACGVSASVAPGLYVVKSGEVSAKIIVR